MPKQICKNQNISDVNATCITFYLIANVFLQVSEDNIYIVDVLWGQSIKLIQVAFNSELRENQWNDLLFFEIVPSHCFGASEVQT